MSLRSSLKSLKSTAPVDDEEFQPPVMFNPDEADFSGNWDNTTSSLSKSSRSKSERAYDDETFDNSLLSSRSELRAKNRFAADITSDPKYAGKVIKSAKKAFSNFVDDEDEEEESENTEDEEEEEVENEGESDENEDNEEHENSEEDVDDMDVDNDEEDDDEAPKNISESEEESDDDDGDDFVITRGDHIDSELQALVAADVASRSQLKSTFEKDAEKGEGIKKQMNLFESWLEARVKIQNPLKSSMRVPVSSTLSLASEEYEELGPKLVKTQDTIKSLLIDFLEIRGVLLARNSNVTGISEEKTKSSSRPNEHYGLSVEENKFLETIYPTNIRKRKRTSMEEEVATSDDDTEVEKHLREVTSSELWKLINKGFETQSLWINETADNWNRKLAYASGLSAKKSMKLNVLGSDISTQISEMMADPAKLIERTKMKRDPTNRVLMSLEEDLDPPSDQADPNSYEDASFYASLLKEYLSLSTGAKSSLLLGSNTNNSSVLNLKAGYSHSKRDDVDRKASKSRRIRYVVHPKLAHYCAPTPYVVPPEYAVDLDTLIESLFQS